MTADWRRRIAPLKLTRDTRPLVPNMTAILRDPATNTSRITMHFARDRRDARFVPRVSFDRNGRGDRAVALECRACTWWRWKAARDDAAMLRVTEVMLAEWVHHAMTHHPRRFQRSLAQTPGQGAALARLMSPSRRMAAAAEDALARLLPPLCPTCNDERWLDDPSACGDPEHCSPSYPCPTCNPEGAR